MISSGEHLIKHCSKVISESMMGRSEQTQGPFEVNWLPDNRAHIIGTNQLIEASVIMNWPDAVEYYMNSMINLLQCMKRECQEANIHPFSNEHLLVLSEYQIPELPAILPPVCIIHKISDLASFPLKPPENTAFEKLKSKTTCLLIVKPNLENNQRSVLSSLCNLVTPLQPLENLFICNFNCQNGTTDSMRNFSEAITASDKFKCITIVRSELPPVFFHNLLTNLPVYTDLNKLDLSYTPVPDESATFLAENLSKLRQLRCLVLRECKLSDTTCEAVCRNLVHLVNLRILDLTLNPVGSHAEHMIIAIEKQLDQGVEIKLWGLYLRGCKIPNDVMKRLMASWSKCQNIDRMTLIDNDLQGIVESLMISPPPKLRGLYLQASRITGQDVRSICRALVNKKLPFLQRLHLHINALKDEDVEPLIEILENDTERGEFFLNVSDNLLSDELSNKWKFVTRDDLHITWDSNLPEMKKFKQT